MTAEEIVKNSDAIVLAEVTGYTKENEYGGRVAFRAIEVLKGVAPAERFELAGQTESYRGPNENPPPFNFVRPGGLGGNCFADDYKQGGSFLLFFRKGVVAWAPLSATNEEVSGPADPWVWWVKGFLAAHTTDTVSGTSSK